MAQVETEYSGRRVLIKLLLEEPLESAQLDNCRGVRRSVFKVVTLKRDLASVTLFDSSTDPPERRWPE